MATAPMIRYHANPSRAPTTWTATQPTTTAAIPSSATPSAIRPMAILHPVVPASQHGRRRQAAASDEPLSRPLRDDQPGLVGEHHELRAVAGAQLDHRPADVGTGGR